MRNNNSRNHAGRHNTRPNMHPHQDKDLLNGQRELEDAKKKYEKILMMKKCSCKHYDPRTGDPLLVEFGKEGMRKCSACDTEVFTSPDMVTKETFDEAMQVINTFIALVRLNVKVDPVFDDNLTKSLGTLHQLPEVVTAYFKQMEEAEKRRNNQRNGRHNRNQGQYVSGRY